MHLCMNDFDWNQIRAFQATVEAGSLSGAARALGLSQPTLSRQVAALEASLGVALFERVGKRLALTEPGRALAAHATAMRQSAAALSLAAAGQSEAVEGLVSVSASDAVARYLLPPILARLRQSAPGLHVHVLVTNAISDLRRREADIAVRHVRPEEPELFGRLLREGTAGFFASKAWIERHGQPRTAADARSAAFIGSGDVDRMIDYLRRLGLELGPNNFPLRCDDATVSWELARLGLGIAPIMHDMAATMPELVEVLQDLPPIRFPFWLVAHRELRTSRRVRLVYDALAEGLAAPVTGHAAPEP